MRKFMAYLFVWIALGVMQLHAVIPHQHHEELGEISHEELHENASSLTEVFALLFHIEMGNEEVDSVLPGVQNIQAPTLSFSPTSPLDLSLLSLRISNSTSVFVHLTAPLLKGYYTPSQLRGPPYIV